MSEETVIYIGISFAILILVITVQQIISNLSGKEVYEVVLFILGLGIGSLAGIMLMAVLTAGKRQQEIKERVL